jgi:hypothetical protein
MPMRAIAGANWDGSVVQWTERPELYGAIHFHSDDMADCGWQPDLTLEVPADWRSGFYALKLTAREGSDDPVVGVHRIGPVRLEQPVPVLLVWVRHQGRLRGLVLADGDALGGHAAERGGADDAGRDAGSAEDLADGAHWPTPRVIAPT